MRAIRAFSLSVLLLMLVAAVPSSAQSYDGVFTGQSEDGPTRFELRQSGSDVTGVMTIGKYRLTLDAKLDGGKAYGIAEASGAPVRFGVLLTLQGDALSCGMAVLKADGQLDAESKTMLSLTRAARTGGSTQTAGGFSVTGGAQASSTRQRPSSAGRGGRSSTIDTTTMATLAGRVKANFKPQGKETVLAAGDPPLTVASLYAFAELMRLTLDVNLTESEFDITRRQFVTFYEKGDAGTKKMLAQGWQDILAQIQSSGGDERARAIKEVRDIFTDRFAKGAQAGIPWYVAMQATIERRHQHLVEMTAPLPTQAPPQMHLKRDLTEADLDASLEMLYFMWVACGRDASLVTMESVAYVRAAIVQNFALFPADVQLIFANAQQVYGELRGQWAQATPEQRLQLAYGFSSALDALGLVVPSAGGGEGGGAWSDMSGQSHGEWAASMVQGLAGSSYKSAW